MPATANVEIVEKEMIKPSSPTPHHLKQHKFSYIDQFTPNMYIPLIFFYEANQKYSNQLLKASLSIALTHYYPFAGRISDSNYHIDCNDAGALFVEAKVQLDADLNFDQFIENPDMDDLKKLLPLDHDGDVILVVQINLFVCGGTAIGVQMSHKLGDGNSLVNFMNAWAAICRRGDDDIELIMNPRFDSASLFPPIDLSTVDNFKSPVTLTPKEKIVTKRLIFDKEKLEILKAEVKEHCHITPTRVEVVSALIWKRLMEVTGKSLLTAVHAVNLRPRMHPSLPDCTIGNIVTLSVALPLPMNEGGVNGSYQGLVSNLRVAFKSIDENVVRKMQNMDAHEYMRKIELFAKSISKGEIVPCYITSWCRFPVYEVDYGWGEPVWVSTVTLPVKNSVVLLTTKNGDGIEAWLNMLEEDASIFESDVSNLVSCP